MGISGKIAGIPHFVSIDLYQHLKDFPFFSLVSDLSPEAAAMLLAAVIGGYTLIGGLGATFYVSYFNTALIFVLILMLVVEVSLEKCPRYNGLNQKKSIS